MPDRQQLLAEAYRRGLMNPQQKAAYEEAQRRGIVRSAASPNRKPNVLDDISGAWANLEGKIPFYRDIQTGLAAAVQRPGDAARSLLLGPTLDPGASQRYAAQVEANRERLSEVEKDYEQRHPYVANTAQGAGLGASLLLPGPKALNTAVRPVTAPTMAGRAGQHGMNAARSSVAAGTVGPAYALGNEGSLPERIEGASETILPSMAMGAGAPLVVSAVGARLGAKRPRPIPSGVQTMAKEGVQMTPGQIRGGAAKMAEDAATSLPILGPQITAARIGSVESYVASNNRRALERMGAMVPPGMKGSAAIKHVGDTISKGYEELLPTGGVKIDDDMGRSFANIRSTTETLTPDNQARLAKIVEQRVASRFNADGGILSGDMYKRVTSELDSEIARFSKSPDPDHQAMGEALKGVRGAIEDAAARQNPEFAKRLSELDAAWNDLVVIENAAAKGSDGLYTPAQYEQAQKMGDARIRKRGFVRGELANSEVGAAAKSVLPSQVPNSGTADRAGLLAALTAPVSAGGALLTGHPDAAMAALAAPAAASVGLAAAGNRLYSPQAIERANIALNVRLGENERRLALQELQKLAAEDPAAQKLFGEVMGRLTLGVGIGTALSTAPNGQ